MDLRADDAREVEVWNAYSEDPGEAALQLRKLISWVSRKVSAILQRAIAAYNVEHVSEFRQRL